MRRLVVILCLASLSLADGATRFVSLSGSHTSPYTNWAMAATNLAAAFAVASGGDTVLVTNGYHLYPETNYSATNLTLQSVNGPTVTTIDGTGSYKGNIPGLLKYLSASSNTISGFTFTRFYSGYSALIYSVNVGYLLVENCVVTNMTGGGGNPGYVIGSDGATDNVIIRNCIFARNNGLGGYGSLFSQNTGATSGSWQYEGLLITCNTDNTAYVSGMAAVLWVNGPTNVTWRNCTIADNKSLQGYGVAYVNAGSAAIFENCIIWGNTGADGSNSTSGIQGIYTDTAPILSGEGNISEDPEFVGAPNYSLASGSPCIDVGTNRAWMVGALDLAGNDRIYESIVDLGAYEFQGAPPPSARRRQKGIY